MLTLWLRRRVVWSLTLGALCAVSVRGLSGLGAAEEQPKVKEGAKKEKAHVKEVKIKEEPHDLMKVGTKGTSEGSIVSVQNGKLVLATKVGNVMFMPYWRGGNPKDGGGMDKAMLGKLEGFKVGDAVRIGWSWDERRRIDTIVKQ